MQEHKDYIAPDTDEKEIDLLELAGKLWDNRKKIIKWGICGAIIGLIVAFSIPKEFITTTKLSPEITDSKQASGGLSALASMAGFGGGSAGGADAVYPQLYPDVVSSVPFLTGLFDVEVETKNDGEKFTVQQFIEDETSGPWWGFILGIPGKILGLLKSSEKVEEGHVLNNFQLTMDEDILVKALAQRVTASVDQKTSVVTISVQMQDPLVSAILADTVVSRLQNYITDYRTNKARKDLEYAEKLNSEAQQEYYRAQQTLADYTDRNQGLATQSARITRDRLENEAQLAFSLYNQTAQQVQKAKAKVQENTPVYAVVVPPTVPVKAASPRKPLILVGFTFLAVVACSGWILFLQPLIEERKRNLTNTSSNGADAGKA